MKARIFKGVRWLGALALLISVPSWADRAGKYEFTFQVPYLYGETFEFEGDASASINSDPGFGFSAGYNYSDHLTFRGNFTWNDTGYNAERVLDDGANTRQPVSGVMDTFSASASLDYNLLRGAFTPFVNAGVGWAAVDSNIASGPPEGVCWWDPWWGYICNNYQPTYTADTFAYSLGAGLRLDLNQRMFLRLGYYERWLDLDRAQGTTSLGSTVFELGFMH